MKHRILTAGIAALAIATPAIAAPLTVTVNGVEDRGATLYIGVQTEAQFMKNDGVAGEIMENAAAGTHTVSFDLPEGDYSVSVWHDLNGNGEFDRAENGMPEEGWAMSNGSNLRGEPSFADVSVNVYEDGASVTETVRYPQ
ncbi:MAG: DUF2141 domain-containing protein [Henriciella sp.]|uniref:DUF2141 domain-containing protein n=1 Tax=Henriciella sp. TaxID=1968823 RepID=UPI003C774814